MSPRPHWAAAFLTWLDDQPSPVTVLQVAIERDAGHPDSYRLRHVDDTAAADLSPVTDLLELARTNAAGEYRSLPTADDLRRGWVCDDLDEDALLDALETLYPAAIAVWHAERSGTLQVLSWQELASRQTGLQGITKRVDDADAQLAARIHCHDGGCLRRPLWDISDETPLDRPRTDGLVPCYEPCSLLVSFFRKVALYRRGEEIEEPDRLWQRFVEAVGPSA